MKRKERRYQVHYNQNYWEQESWIFKDGFEKLKYILQIYYEQVIWVIGQW